MPYQNEFADKTSHIDIVQNPDVEEFLNKCHKIKDIDDEELSSAEQWFDIPVDSGFHKPDNIISIDGSFYESSIQQKFPSKKVGFIKVGVVLLKGKSLSAIQGTSRFVDPYEVAKIKENNESYSFVLPSTNICWNSAVGSATDS